MGVGGNSASRGAGGVDVRIGRCAGGMNVGGNGAEGGGVSPDVEGGAGI